jgi:hypothetical protein
MLQGQLPVGSLDLVLSCILFDAENLVEIGCNRRASRSVVFVGRVFCVVILFVHILVKHFLGIRMHGCGVYGSRCRGKEMGRETGKVWPKTVIEPPKDSQNR